MRRIQKKFLFLVTLFLLGSLSCNRSPNTGSAQLSANASRDQTSADALGTDLISPEDVSSETTKDVKASPLVLPTSFGRRTGDLDEMLKARRIRALVVINPIGFFYSHGKPKGLNYEMLEQFQAYVNKKPKTGALDVKITFIPLRPDELGSALRARGGS